MAILQRVIIKKVLGCLAAATILVAGLGFGVGLKPDQANASSGDPDCTHVANNGSGFTFDVCLSLTGDRPPLDPYVNITATPDLRGHSCSLDETLYFAGGYAAAGDNFDCSVRKDHIYLVSVTPGTYYNNGVIFEDGNNVASGNSPEQTVGGSFAANSSERRGGIFSQSIADVSKTTWGVM